MMDQALLDSLARLPAEEKIEAIEFLEGSLQESAAAEFPLTDWQKEELDRRLEEMEKNPEALIPWEQVKRELYEGL